MTALSSSPKKRTPKKTEFSQDSVDARILTLGKNLKIVRKNIYKENLQDFSLRLNICVNTLRKMEEGHPGIAIATWFQAFTIMQVATDVLEASRPEALILANQQPRTNNWNVTINNADTN